MESKQCGKKKRYSLPIDQFIEKEFEQKLNIFSWLTNIYCFSLRNVNPDIFKFPSLLIN